MDELKSCPFCGGEVIHTSFAELERIECLWCNLKMEDDVSYFALEVAWNTRKDNWININDRFPIIDTCVDIWISLPDGESGRVTNVFLNKDNNFWCHSEDMVGKVVINSKYATHWQKLPEKP